MKISKNTLLLGAAVTLGILCFVGAQYYLRSYLSQAESRLAGSYKTKEVIVAAIELAAGSILTEDDLAFREIPERYLASSVVGLESLDAILGQRLLTSVSPGDPLDRAWLEHSDRAAFSRTIQAGERAITFPVDEISSISGMLIPGDIIDLMFTGQYPSQYGTPASQVASRNRGAELGGNTANEQLNVRLILQSVPVLATGKITKKQTIQADNGMQREIDVDFNTVTLKVNPAEAQQILLSQKLGQLTAVLRNPEDKQDLGNMALDEATFKQIPQISSINPGEYVDIIVGGTGAAGGMKMRSEVAENPLAAMFDSLIQSAINKPSGDAVANPPTNTPVNSLDVKSRLGLNSQPTPATNAPLSKRHKENG